MYNDIIIVVHDNTGHTIDGRKNQSTRGRSPKSHETTFITPPNEQL